MTCLLRRFGHFSLVVLEPPFYARSSMNAALGNECADLSELCCATPCLSDSPWQFTDILFSISDIYRVDEVSLEIFRQSSSR